MLQYTGIQVIHIISNVDISHDLIQIQQKLRHDFDFIFSGIDEELEVLKSIYIEELNLILSKR